MLCLLPSSLVIATQQKLLPSFVTMHRWAWDVMSRKTKADPHGVLCIERTQEQWPHSVAEGPFIKFSNESQQWAVVRLEGGA